MNERILHTIFGMFLVTFIPRLLPTLFFSKYQMPKFLKRIIRFVPISVFSFLIVKDVLFVGGQLAINFNNLSLLPAIVTAIIAYKFKSIGLTIGIGILSYLAYQYGLSGQLAMLLY